MVEVEANLLSCAESAEIAAYLSFADSGAQPDLGIESEMPQRINTLPPELLAKIFTFCLSPTLENPHKHKSPLLVASICRWWRTISLVTPELWDHLKIDASSSRLIPGPGLVRLWLERSRMRPLTLTLGYEHHPETEGPQEQALPILLEHSARWRRIDFLLAKLKPETWNTLEGVTLPMLVDAEIKVHANLLQSQLDTIARLLTSSPRLTRFVWSHPLRTSRELQIPWHQLTTLWLHCPTLWSQLLGTLGQCIRLTSCVIVPIFKAGFPTPPLPTVSVPLLASLDARIFTDLPSIPECFDAFTLPKLTKLTFTIARGSTSLPSWPHAEYISFAMRSNLALNTLILENTNITEDELIQCLEQSHNSLRRLNISGRVRNVSDKLLRRLTISPDRTGEGVESGLCPLLETIQFMDGCLWSSDGILGEMVRSRWHPDNVFTQGLWQLSADLTISVDQEHDRDREILDSLKREGLVLHLVDKQPQRLAIGWF